MTAMSGRKRTVRRLVWLCMVAAALVLSPLRLLDVCLADDGHWTLESAHAGPVCDAHLVRHHVVPGSMQTDEAATHRCVDVAAMPSANRGRSRTSCHAVTVMSIATIVDLRCVSQAKRFYPSHAPREATLATTLRRSVVIVA